MDEAFNRDDIEAILGFYDDNAVMVIEPGCLARGKAELRQAFETILQMGGSAQQLQTHILETDGNALFTSRWAFTMKSAQGEDVSREFVATSVFRKNAEGRWLLIIDNSFGPAVLGT